MSRSARRSVIRRRKFRGPASYGSPERLTWSTSIAAVWGACSVFRESLLRGAFGDELLVGLAAPGRLRDEVDHDPADHGDRREGDHPRVPDAEFGEPGRVPRAHEDEQHGQDIDDEADHPAE